MSNGVTYGITLRGDAKQLVGEVKGVQSAFDGLSASTQRNQSQAQQLNVAQSATAEHMRRTNSEAVRLNQSTGLLSSGFSALKNAIAGVGLAVLVTGLVTTADKVTNLQARLSLATKSQLEYNVAQSALFDISQRNYAPLEATYTLYSRMAPAMRDLGASQAQTLRMTDLVGKSMRISGAGAAESASTMMQFSQALGSGVLRGDEFNSMMEASPRLMRALADGMNRPIGELRGMAEQGKLTADVVVNALLSQGEKITAEYGKMPLTVSAAWVKLGNVATQEIGRMNSAIGGTSAIAGTLSGLASNFDQVTNAAGALTVGVAAFGALKAGSMVMEHVVALRAQQAAALSVAQAELARVNMTYTATAASRAAAASAVAQASANMTLTGSIAAATAAMRAFVLANPFLVIASGIAVAAFAVKSFFDDATKGFGEFQSKMRSASAEELRNQRQQLAANIVDMQHSTFKGFYERDIRAAQDQVRMIDGQLARMEQRAAAVKDKPIAPVKNTADTTKQQESEAKRYAAAIQAANDRIAAFEAETSAAVKLTEAEKQLAVFNEQIAAGTTRMTAAHQQNVRAKLESVVASERSRDAILAEQKAREESVKKMDSESKSLTEKIAAAELETSYIGKTKAEIDLLQAARYDHETQIMRETLATKESANACTAETEALREGIKLREKWRTVQTDQSAARTRQEQIDLERKAQVGMWKSIEDAAHQTFISVANGSKDLWTRTRDTAKNIFFDWLYQMTVKKWVVSVAMSASGGAATAADFGMTGGSAGGSGVGSWLNAGQTLWSAFSGGMATSLGSVAMAAGEMFGSAALSEFGVGALYSAGGGSIAGAFAGSAASGMGAAIATALPWVAGALAISSLFDGNIFGSSKGVSGPTTLSGQFTGQGFGGQYMTPWYQQGGWFSASGGGYYTNPVGADQADAFSGAVGSTKALFDSLASSAGTANKSLDGWSYSFNQAVDNQEQATAVLKAMADSMGAYLLPELKQFQSKGETLADTAVRLRGEFVLTDSVLNLTGGTFGAVGLASAKARDELVKLLGGVESMSGAMQAYYDNFYTNAERNSRSMAALTEQFAAIGLSMPSTAAGFRSLVNAQDLSTAAGRVTFAALMSLNSAFTALVPNAEAAAQALRDNIKALQDKASADYADARRSVDGLRAFAASVRELQRSLWAGAQAPGGVNAAGTRADFVATNAAAAAGDTAAQGRLSGSASAYLDAAKAQASSALEYARDFAFVQTSLSETASLTDTAVTVADAQLAQLVQVNEWLSAIDSKNATQNQSLEYLLSASIASSEAARQAVVTQAVGNAISSIEAAVTASGGSFDAASVAQSVDAATGATNLSYVSGYNTLSAEVSKSGSVSQVSTAVDTVAKAAADAAAAHAAEVSAALIAFSEAKATSDALRERVRGQMLSDYQQETPTQGYIGWRYPGVAQADITAYWDAYSNKRSAYQAISNLGAPLPSFAVGINEVPHDMVAQIHAGEEIKSKPFVDAERTERAENNRLIAKLVDGMELLRRENKVLLEAVASNTLDTANMGRRWNNDGMPATRAA